MGERTDRRHTNTIDIVWRVFRFLTQTGLLVLCVIVIFQTGRYTEKLDNVIELTQNLTLSIETLEDELINLKNEWREYLAKER